MIYEKVLSYCEKEGMSIAAFEKKCAIGNGVVRAWKDNNSHPSVSTLQKMEKCTGIPIAKWLSSCDPAQEGGEEEWRI